MFGRKSKLTFRTPAEALAKAGRPYLNVGCGAHFHADWVNVDIAPTDPSVCQHNLLEGLPFENATFEAVYHSHVLEHLPRAKAVVLISECFRVLRPGGVLRIAVPDLETITRLYLQNLEAAAAGDITATRRHEWMTLELLDQMVREQTGGEMLNYWDQNPMPEEEFVVQRMGREVLIMLQYLRKPGGYPRPPAPSTPQQIGEFRMQGEVHKWMYDRISLRTLLTAAGFQTFRVCSATDSKIENFSSYQLDLWPDGSVRKPDSLFVEAEKP